MRVYEGRALPADRVARIRCCAEEGGTGTRTSAGTEARFHVVEVAPPGASEPLLRAHVFELLPGTWTLSIRCLAEEYYTGAYKRLDCTLEAGKRYEIRGAVGEMDAGRGELTWTVRIVEIP